MFLEIVTPERKIFEGEIRLIQLPGSQGSFEILKNHAPVISTLDAGELRIVLPDGEEHNFEIEGGVVECNGNKIIVLAENT